MICAVHHILFWWTF